MFEPAVLPQKGSKRSVIVVWWQPPHSFFDSIYGKMLLYDKDEDFYILQK